MELDIEKCQNQILKLQDERKKIEENAQVVMREKEEHEVSSKIYLYFLQYFNAILLLQYSFLFSQFLFINSNFIKLLLNLNILIVVF